MTRWEPASDVAPPDDHHTWARLLPDDCPHCECCTTPLCAQARERLVACSDLATAGRDLVWGCPCPERVDEEPQDEAVPS